VNPWWPESFVVQTERKREERKKVKNLRAWNIATSCHKPTASK